MNDTGQEPTPFKFFEGWLQHKGKEYASYTNLWMVLKDSVIYIFTDSNVGIDTHIGKLTIDKYTEFKRGGDDKGGYKFELITGYGQTRKKNKFRSQKKVVMEMWRGYLVGLAAGNVPDDLDLLQEQVVQIQSDIDYFRTKSKSNQSVRSLNTDKRMSAADSGINVDGASIRSTSTGKTLGAGSDGGPTMRHKFTNNHSHLIVDQTPSWFFENCSRQQAEIVLKNGSSYGNTLMRLSSTHKDHGSYVISKYFDKTKKFEHFEVLRVANGYKINVENQHNAMSNLTEVMNYFVETAGLHDTRPMTSNRLGDYGLEEPDYATRFYLEQSDPREFVNRRSVTISSGPEEPLPDYEEPVRTAPLRTYTPGILKKEGAKYYSRQSTGEVGQTQLSYSTVAHGNRSRIQRAGFPTVQDFEQRVGAAAQLKNLDEVISAFEPPAQEEEYVNKEFFIKERTGHFVPDRAESPPPPPPPPHAPVVHSYTNEETSSVLSMPLPPPPAPEILKPPSPPPAPPAPPISSPDDSDPRMKHLRSKSVPNVAEGMSELTLRNQGLNKAVTGDMPSSVLRSSQRYKPPSQETPAVTRPKSLAATENSNLTPSSSVPRFASSPQKLRQTSLPNINPPPPPVPDSTPEIDETALSPVDDIRKKFEPSGKTKTPGKKIRFENDPPTSGSPSPIGTRNRLNSEPVLPTFNNENTEDNEESGIARGTRSSFKQRLETLIGGNTLSPSGRGIARPQAGNQPPPVLRNYPQGEGNTPRSKRGSLPPTPTEQFYEELPENSIPPDNTNA